MVRKAVLVLALLILGVVGAQAQEATPAGTHDVTFFLTYIPNIQFSPVYVALEQRYFADAGFNVTLQSGDEPDGINLIAANQLQFGLASGEQVIAARAQGRPVEFVYEWFQKYPIGILVTNDSGVSTPAELKGTKIGIPGLFGASYTGAIALLNANGMTEQDVQLDTIGFNAPQVVCVGAVKEAVVYVNNEPLQIQNLIDSGGCGSVTSITVFPVSDVADMVSNGIITNEDTITSNPDEVRAFVAAFDHGLRDVINNPAQAYLLSAPYIEGLPLPDDFKAALEREASVTADFWYAHPHPTRETMRQSRADLLDRLKQNFDSDTLLQFEVLLSSIDMWDADQLGYTDPQSWQLTADTLVQMGLLNTAPDLTGAYSNDFLPTN